MTTISTDPPPTAKAGRHLLRTILIILGILLVYAFAVQMTEISLEKPLDPNRQDSVMRVLRLLADPDLITIDGDTGSIALSEASRITIERIIETIFMALLASAVGTLLAVPLSFLAARNLMADITAPLAAIMAGVIGLPIGGALGWAVATGVGGLADMAMTSAVIGTVVMLIAFGLFWALLRFGPTMVTHRKLMRGEVATRLVRLAVMALLLVLGLALLARISQEFGAWLEPLLGPFGFLGNFIKVMGDFLRLLLPAILALLGAGLVGSLGSGWGQELVLSISTGPARVISAVVSAVGAFIIIYAIGSALNWLYLFDDPASWTTIPALIGGGITAVIALLLPPKRPFNIGLLIYTITRSILNILRSIEPLIMGIVFVVWVSLGPFAGIMALTLHSIAALGKLFSEQVEGINDGPVEAITATGASRLQTIVFAVIPQIIPPFTAFALYRWDINVRMSTIIGFVGGGGIGFVLSQNISQLRYRQASVMMLAIAIVVMTLDYFSARIRSRII